MGRKHRNAAKRKPFVPVEELVAPTPEMMAKGNVLAKFVVHVEDWTTAKAHRVSNILDQWFDQGQPGFDDPARAAIDWCLVRWEARGVIGKQCANYSPTCGTGGGNVVRDIELRDELDDVRKSIRVPAVYWDVFENVCRWGEPAGVAGSDFANNNPQAIASARAIVGLVANLIASDRGF
jgi:hypothetical protein